MSYLNINPDSSHEKVTLRVKMFEVETIVESLLKNGYIIQATIIYCNALGVRIDEALNVLRAHPEYIKWKKDNS